MQDFQAPDEGAGVLRQRIEEVRSRIDAAALRSGREGREVTLVAVTKTYSVDVVREAKACGLRDFGENYVQEALAKQAALTDTTNLRWHLIGHLQSNKTNLTCGRFSLIQSVDSLRLADRIGRTASSIGAVQDILIQVKLGDDQAKTGAAPADVVPLCAACERVTGVRVLGLMAIAPLGADGRLTSQPRPFFAQARQLFDRLPSEQRTILSMGMSADFEIAIEEGSNLVRIGTSLFGNRAAALRSAARPNAERSE